MNPRHSTNQRGYMLLVALFLIIIVAGASAVLLNRLSRNQVQTTDDTLAQAQMQVDVNSAINIAMAKLMTPVTNTVVSCSQLNNTQQSLPDNTTVTYTTTGYTASAAVNQTISPSSTALYYTSPSGNFAPQGVVMIGNEIISYTGVGTNASACPNSGNTCLTGASRGILGTSADYHYVNSTPPFSSISQNQCTVTATLTTSQQIRTTASFIVGPLASGLASGFNVNQNYQWNTALSPNQWSAMSAPSSPSIFGNLLLSPNSGWAVDLSGGIFFWNGTRWMIPPSNSNSTLLDSVTCPTENLCFMGGSETPSGVTSAAITEYLNNNGTVQWFNDIIYLSAYNSQVTGIACPSSSQCVAVTKPTNPSGSSQELRWPSTQPNAPASVWDNLTNNPLTSYSQQLLGVSCIRSGLNSGKCYAVGGNNGSRSTILQWDGNTWQFVSISGVDQLMRLSAISCTPTYNPNVPECWAVSQSSNSSNNYFAEMLGNGTWQYVQTNLPYNFNSISCTNAANNCWASNLSSGQLAHWDGSQWSMSTTLNTAAISAISMAAPLHPLPLFLNQN